MVVGVAVVLLALVVPWAAAWVAARPGGRPWGLVLFVVGCLAVAGAVSGVRRLTRRRLVVGLAAWAAVASSVASLWAYQSGSLLYRRLAPELEHLASVAQNAGLDDSRCQDLPSGSVDVPGYGSVDQMCQREYGTEFHGPAATRSLVYLADDVSRLRFGSLDQLEQQCVLVISDHWIERAVPDGRDCPAGFTTPTTLDLVDSSDFGY